MADSFSTLSGGPDGPPTHVAAAAKSDTVDLDFVTTGISLTVAGDIKLITAGGETVTFLSGALAIGVIHRIRVARIFLTGTAATGIWVYW